MYIYMYMYKAIAAVFVHCVYLFIHVCVPLRFNCLFVHALWCSMHVIFHTYMIHDRTVTCSVHKL